MRAHQRDEARERPYHEEAFGAAEQRSADPVQPAGDAPAELLVHDPPGYLGDDLGEHEQEEGERGRRDGR